MPRGQKHLIKCRCILPQFKGRKDAPVHKFVVFSVINDDDTVVVKYSSCNNCGTIHKIVDICASEILQKKEDMSTLMTIEDIKTGLPPNLSDILERNGADLPTWEQAAFIYDNKAWGEFVVLTQEEEADTKQGKYVRIMGESFFKIDSFSREEVAVPK